MKDGECRCTKSQYLTTNRSTCVNACAVGELLDVLSKMCITQTECAGGRFILGGECKCPTG
jgi:hypothetical protein